VSGVLCGALACGKETVAPLKPGDYVGHYQLAEVDGHQLGWYHQLAAVDCSAAFTTGRLTIAPDRYFHLSLRYNFRCLGTDPFDGEGVLGVSGDDIRSTKDVIVLNGYGPDLIGPGADRWSLEVRPQGSGDRIEVRFWGFAREYWADPILMMGPKETYDPACIPQSCS
jgi:hypothetical protein